MLLNNTTTDDYSIIATTSVIYPSMASTLIFTDHTPGSSDSTAVTEAVATPGSSDIVSLAVTEAVAGVVVGLVICTAVTVLLIIIIVIFKKKMKMFAQATEETFTVHHNPLYKTGKGLNTAAYHHVATPHTGQVTLSTSTAIKHEDEYSTGIYSVPFSTGTDTSMKSIPSNDHPMQAKSMEEATSKGTQNGKVPAVDHNCTYTTVDQISIEPDKLVIYQKRQGSNEILPVHTGKLVVVTSQKQKTSKRDDEAMAASEKGKNVKLGGGEREGSEKSAATAGAVYAVVDKKRKNEDGAMIASVEGKNGEVGVSEPGGSERSAIDGTCGAVYAVVDKKKKKPPPPPPPPPPYQP